MTNTKTTKRALAASVLSIVICLTMLIGSTFAWFTDSATTGVNTIQSGNLDMKVSYKNKTQAEWKEVSTNDKLFNDSALWEPGYTEVAYLKVENKGSLAFKYQLTVNVLKEITATSVLGNEIKLSEVLKYDLIPLSSDTTYATRADAMAAVENAKNLATETVSDSIDAKATAKYYALVVYMPESTANEANHNGTAPSIQLGVNIVATQNTVESDSFNNRYDANALFNNERMATNDAELAQALAESSVDTIYLNGNFGATILPLGTDGVTLIGQNNATMQSLNINGAKNVVIDGLTFDAAKAQVTHVNKANGAATDYTASVYEDRTVANNAAMNACENVTIKNCTFSGTATVDGETGYTAINFNDGGAGTRSANITVENCRFNCNAVSYVYIQYVDDDSYVTITKNTFGNTGYSTAWAAVAVQQLNNVDVKITDNIFYNWDAEDGAVKVSRKSGEAITPTATITGNTFNGTVADNSAVIEIRRAGDSGHTISGNTYNITDKTLTDESVEVRTDNNDPSTAVAVWYRQINS